MLTEPGKKLVSPDLGEGLRRVCGEIYSPGGVLPESLKIGETTGAVIGFARLNRLAHYLALRADPAGAAEPELEKLRGEYRRYREQLKAALAAVADGLDREPYIVIKTVSSFPHPTNDLDVIVKDLSLAGRITGREFFPDGATHLATDERRDRREGRLLLHFGIDITWTGVKAVSDRLLWSDLQTASLDGREFPVPSPLTDILIRIGHAAFETGHLKLGELLHIFRLAADADWTALDREAGQMGWPRTFGKMTDLLEFLHRALFRRPFLDPDTAVSPRDPRERISFPVELPLSLLAGGVVEKRAWRKLAGAKYIIKDRLIRWHRKNFH